VLRLLRHEGQGEARAVVEAGGVSLDAVLREAGPWARRGAHCRLALRTAQVFGAGGERARGAPLVERALLRG
jgi:hypothetical protein